MSELTNEELLKIMELLQEAYKEAGREIQTAILVDEIAENGELSGELLIDNRDKEDLN